MLKYLTETELSMIDDYRLAYAPLKEEFVEEQPAPIEKILIPWANAKNCFLNRLFENNLILEKEIEFSMSHTELREKMYEKVVYPAPIFGESKGINIERDIPIEKRFLFVLNTWLNKKWDAIQDYDTKWLWARMTGRLTSTDALATNILLTNVSLDIDGVKIDFPAGMKVTKALKKIGKILNIPYFEEFRIAHSQVLNTKKIKGTLCLSIHPLDYMTMSDNENDWSSCMSWQECGCYRQGTVEMMNSSCVVVGYLKSNSNMNVPKGEWNSKKWRSLFVVNDDMITNVKSYPYASDDLEKHCLDWLKELCEKNLSKEFYPTLYKYNNDHFIDIDDKNWAHFDFKTDVMYNDFPHTNDLKTYISKDCELNTGHCYNYSGMSECMWCGDTDDIGWECDHSDNQGILLCSNCETLFYCECCNERMSGSEPTYEIDGETLCESCYINSVVTDPFTGEEHLQHNCVRVDVMKLENDCRIAHFWVDRDYWEDLLINNITDYFETVTPISYWNEIYEVKLEDVTDNGMEIIHKAEGTLLIF